MDETVISWTAENFFTVVLMAFLGFMVLGLAMKLVGKIKVKSDD